MQPKNIIMWALTYRCNMSCEYCFVRQKVENWDEIDDSDCLSLAKKLCDSFSNWKPDAIWLTGGEPTLRTTIGNIIETFELNNIKAKRTSDFLSLYLHIES